MPIQFLWTLIWNHPLVVHYLAHSPLPQLHFFPTKPSRDSSSPCHMLPLNWCLLRKEWFIGSASMLEGSTTCHQPMPQCLTSCPPVHKPRELPLVHAHAPSMVLRGPQRPHTNTAGWHCRMPSCHLGHPTQEGRVAELDIGDWNTL